MTISENLDTPIDSAKQEELLNKFDKSSALRSFENSKVRYFVFTLAVIYSLFHLYITYNPMPELLQRSAHVSIGLCLIFLLYPAGKNSSRSRTSWIDWLLFVGSAASMTYLFVEYQNIVTTRGGIPNTTDIVFSMITVVLVFESARRIMGWEIGRAHV